MTLRLLRPDEVPPGGWRYFQAETKIWLEAPSFVELCERVRRHRLANNIPIGTEWKQEIETQVCERAPAGICERDGQRQLGGDLMDFDTVVRGTKTIVSWFLAGREKVSLDESVRRAAICSTCHFNQEMAGCKTCSENKLHEIVKVIVGNDSFSGREHLKVCGKCGCSLAAKVRLPLDLLQKHTDKKTMESLPQFCWLKL